jgi:hypothetical protein
MMEIVWGCLRKLKIQLPYDPALLGIYPKESMLAYRRDICTPMFIAALFIRARLWHQSRYICQYVNG